MEAVKDINESMKLEGISNYSIWSFKLKQIFLREKLWRFVEPTEAQGESSIARVAGQESSTADSKVGGTPGSGDTKKQKAAKTESSAAQDIDAELRLKALVIINLSVRDFVIPHLRRFSDPSHAWKRLKELYETDNVSRRLALR